MTERLTRRTMLQVGLGALAASTIGIGTASGSRDPEEIPGEEWPQYGRDGGNTGYNPNAEGPVPGGNAELVELWSYDFAAGTVPTPPAVTARKLLFTEGTALLDFEPETGEMAQLYEGDDELFGTPAAPDTDGISEEVYVTTTDGAVLDISRTTGNEIWRQNTDNNLVFAPSPLTLRGGTLYAAGESAIVEIDTEDQSKARAVPIGGETGPAAGTQSVWVGTVRGVSGITVGWLRSILNSEPVNQGDEINGKYATMDARGSWIEQKTPTVYDEKVLIPGFGLTNIDAATGEVLWSLDLNIMITAPPSVGDEMIYFGSGTDIEDIPDELEQNAGRVYAMRTDPVSENREEIRSELNGKRELLADLIEEEDEEEIERVAEEIEGLEDELAETIQLDKSDTSWTFETDGPINSKIAIGNGTVFVASDDGHVYALDTADGTERWRYELVDTPDNDASMLDPIVVDDRLYVGSQETGLVALGVENVSEDEGGNDGTEDADGTTGDDDSDEGGESDDTDESEEEESDDGFAPGFGVPAAVSALGGTSYLLGRQLRDDEDQSG